MKLKKYMKLMEDEPQEEMTEHELELYNSLLERVEKNAAVRTAKRVKFRKICAPIVSTVLLAIITLTCVFTLNRVSNEILYKDDKVITQESNVQEMLKDIQRFDLSNFESLSNQVRMSYDSISNDKLFYNILAKIENSQLELVIVINEKYNYKFDLKGEVKSVQLVDYTLFYTVEHIRDIPAKKKFRGRIKVQTEIVYFEFFQKPALGDEAFFETIQQVVKVKK